MRSKAKSVVKVVELGCVGHCVVGHLCHWHRHSQIGDFYRVSSIGDYYPDGKNGKRDTLGASDDSFFETMVFETFSAQDHKNEGCGCRAVKSWSEIDCERYATHGEAQAGHERYVCKYLKMARPQRAKRTA